jgi:photosystem II stability/assembly factor-like uncharacterized protein
VRNGKIIGAPGDPQLPVMARYTTDLSRLLKLARLGCDHDLQIHFGQCEDPLDFNRGWEKVAILEAARITQYGTADLGALAPDQRAVVDETVPWTGEDYYEVVPLSFAELAASTVTQQVMGIIVPDRIQCGTCGISSDGCQIVMGVTLRAGGSPGLGADLIYSSDGGGSFGYRNITTLTASNDPDALALVGTNIVVASSESESVHYANIRDILNAVETWTNMSTGFVAGHGPTKIYSFDPSHTWMTGLGGYIYFTADPTASVTPQSSGSATVQDLTDIHGIDQLHIVAVGKSNAVLYTPNGGSTWAAVTGPAVGVDLNAVWMQTKDRWLVGTNGGKLFYTIDQGVNWHEIAFPGSGAGVVRDIVFATPSVGYMAHNTAAPAGRVLRTIDGGHSWYVMPESGASIPANDYVGSLASCDPNVVFGAGLADNATDGFVVKAA